MEGRQQMGRNWFLQKSAVFCGFLRKSAVSRGFLRKSATPQIPCNHRASRKAAKNLRKCAFRVQFLPFAVSLLARPDSPDQRARRKTTQMLAWPICRNMGGVQNVCGEENVPENALSRKFLDPCKRASGLLCRGFLYRKNRALTPEGGGKGTIRGGKQLSVCMYAPYW